MAKIPQQQASLLGNVSSTGPRSTPDNFGASTGQSVARTAAGVATTIGAVRQVVKAQERRSKISSAKASSSFEVEFNKVRSEIPIDDDYTENVLKAFDKMTADTAQGMKRGAGKWFKRDQAFARDKVEQNSIETFMGNEREQWDVDFGSVLNDFEKSGVLAASADQQWVGQSGSDVIQQGLAVTDDLLEDVQKSNMFGPARIQKFKEDQSRYVYNSISAVIGNDPEEAKLLLSAEGVSSRLNVTQRKILDKQLETGSAYKNREADVAARQAFDSVVDDINRDGHSTDRVIAQEYVESLTPAQQIPAQMQLDFAEHNYVLGHSLMVAGKGDINDAVENAIVAFNNTNSDPQTRRAFAAQARERGHARRKLIDEDPYIASTSLPGDSDAFREAMVEANKGEPQARINYLANAQARQIEMGVPEMDTKLMSTAEGEDLAAQYASAAATAKTDIMQGVVQNLRQNFPGEHFNTAMRQLTQEKEMQNTDGWITWNQRNNPDRHALFSSIMRSEFKLSADAWKEISRDVEDSPVLGAYKDAVVNGARSVERLQEYASAYSVLKQVAAWKAQNGEKEPVVEAAKMVFGNYRFANEDSGMPPHVVPASVLSGEKVVKLDKDMIDRQLRIARVKFDSSLLGDMETTGGNKFTDQDKQDKIRFNSFWHTLDDETGVALAYFNDDGERILFRYKKREGELEGRPVTMKFSALQRKGEYDEANNIVSPFSSGGPGGVPHIPGGSINLTDLFPEDDTPVSKENQKVLRGGEFRF